MRYIPVSVKFTSPMAARTLPKVTSTIHTNARMLNGSRPRVVMSTFSTTGWKAFSICTNDTDR